MIKLIKDNSYQQSIDDLKTEIAIFDDVNLYGNPYIVDIQDNKVVACLFLNDNEILIATSFFYRKCGIAYNLIKETMNDFDNLKAKIANNKSEELFKKLGFKFEIDELTQDLWALYGIH
jgi:N-acetylglutamate synthase-like GNAT family acetyltransferase